MLPRMWNVNISVNVVHKNHIKPLRDEENVAYSDKIKKVG
jgi:hypothetical protein